MNILNLLPSYYIEHHYFKEMLSYFDLHIFNSFRIIITHDYNKLPFYGSDVIVILTAGNELGIPPRYMNKVKFVFKHQQAKDKIDNVYHIPLTYTNDFNGNYLISIQDRKYDITFIGRHQKRLDMIQELKTLINFNKYNIYFKDTGTKFSGGLPIQEYANILSNTKIALSPVGGKRCECIRFTEAVKCGCAIIACEHPKGMRVFDNCPANYISNWNLLEKTVDDILSNKSKLNNIHEQMKICWESYFSPKAVATYINKICKGK